MSFGERIRIVIIIIINNPSRGQFIFIILKNVYPPRTRHSRQLELERVTIFKQETDTLAGKVGRLQRTDCQVYIHR